MRTAVLGTLKIHRRGSSVTISSDHSRMTFDLKDGEHVGNLMADLAQLDLDECTHIKIMTEYDIENGDTWEIVRFIQGDLRWYVDTGNIEEPKGFRPYAQVEAKSIDVEHLLRKEYDVRY